MSVTGAFPSSLMTGFSGFIGGRTVTHEYLVLFLESGCLADISGSCLSSH